MTTNKEHWNQVFETDTKTKHASFAELVLKHIKSGKLLDLGCGTGSDTVFFAKTGFDVTALDFSHIGLAKLKKKLGDKKVEMLEADLKDSLPQFQDSSFDIIYSRLSLHYFKNHETDHLFLEIKRILKPAGWLFFMVKSTKDKQYGLGEKIEGDAFNLDGYFRHFFSKKYLLSKLTGFEIVSMTELTKKFKNEAAETIVWEVVAKKL